MINKALKHLWLSTTLSFLLAIQYTERYLDEKNRMLFFWNHWDALTILFSSFLIGLCFFLPYQLLQKSRNKFLKRLAEISFIALLGIAIVKAVENWSLKLGHELPAMSFLIKVMWSFLAGILVVYWVYGSVKVKKAAVGLCLILSPVIPVFGIHLTLTKPWLGSKGQESSLVAGKVQQNDVRLPDTYVFIFDEWSYERSFNDGKLISTFKNLNEFKKTSTLFHEAFSPHDNTLRSLPSIVFQNDYDAVVARNEFYFQDENGNLIPAKQMENIFVSAKKKGYRTALIGFYHPFASFVGDEADFIRTVSAYKMLENNFFQIVSYHLLKNFELYFFRFIPQKTDLIQAVVENRFQTKRTDAIHRMTLSVIQNNNEPTFALFHYSVPHDPYLYDARGPRSLFQIYKKDDPENYQGNLAYLDSLIGSIIRTLKEADKYDESLLIMTSDHSWRLDPEIPKERDNLRLRHVPLFIKLPGQKRTTESNRHLTLSRLFQFLETDSLPEGY